MSVIASLIFAMLMSMFGQGLVVIEVRRVKENNKKFSVGLHKPTSFSALISGLMFVVARLRATALQRKILFH